MKKKTKFAFISLKPEQNKNLVGVAELGDKIALVLIQSVLELLQAHQVLQVGRVVEHLLEELEPLLLVYVNHLLINHIKLCVKPLKFFCQIKLWTNRVGAGCAFVEGPTSRKNIRVWVQVAANLF